MTQAKAAEPPAPLRSPQFLIGQDRQGNWVVQDQNALRGGLFVSRDAALRFVRSENEHRSPAIIMVSGVLELDPQNNPATAPRRPVIPDSHRRAA